MSNQAAATPWIQRLNLFLAKNLHLAQLTNCDLARQMNMSERAFYHRVNIMTGLTPNRYIRAYRMKKAKQMLLSGEYYQVKAVALSVGFAKTAYFSGLFEKTYGLRPKQLINRSLSYQY